MWQNAKALSKSHLRTCCWAFVWVVNMPFQSSLWAKWTWRKKSFYTQFFLAHQKAKLQARHNPWKHEQLNTNKLGQKTDFLGPIIAENLSRNSWLSPAGKWWSRHNHKASVSQAFKCSPIWSKSEILVPTLCSFPHIFTSKQHPNTSSAWGPPCPHPRKAAVFLLVTNLNYKKNPGTGLLFQ